MSQSRSMMLMVSMGAVAYSVTYSATANDVLTMIVTGIAAISAPLIVWYSPYPDSTHNFGAGTKRQKWGFTTEQDGNKWIHEPVDRDGDSQ